MTQLLFIILHDIDPILTQDTYLNNRIRDILSNGHLLVSF